MTKYNYLEIGKTAKKGLKWLLKAASRDSARPVLTKINFETEQAVAANGFVMHVMSPNPLNETGLKKIVSLGSEMFEKDDGESGVFPDWKQVIPTREPRFRFSVNPRMLADSLIGLDGMVTISLYDPYTPILIEGHIGDDFTCKAVVMPMDGGNKENQGIPSRETVEKERETKAKKGKSVK